MTSLMPYTHSALASASMLVAQRLKIAAFALLLSLVSAGGVTAAPKPHTSGFILKDEQLAFRTLRLWEANAPGAHGSSQDDVPTLTLVPPDEPSAVPTAVIIAPGGGYQELATGHEGRQVADWFAAHGVTAFILRYRLISNGYFHPAQLNDAQRAIRWVRAHAKQFGVDPHRIGMVGFSAGGHLTGMAETIFDAGDPKALDPVNRESSRPDFAVLVYAALVFDADDPTPKLFAGTGASEETIRKIKPSLNVSAIAPPTFILQTSEDRALAPSATGFYDALLSEGVPVELHIFEHGKHGFGLGMTDSALSVWPDLLATWMRVRGLLQPVGRAASDRGAAVQAPTH